MGKSASLTKNIHFSDNERHQVFLKEPILTISLMQHKKKHVDAHYFYPNL